MSSRSSKTFDINTWAQGHRGIFDPSVTDKPYIKNMQMYSTGVLGPRNLWNFVWQESDTYFDGNNVALVVPTEFRNGNTTEEGFLAIANDDLDPFFIKWITSYTELERHVDGATAAYTDHVDGNTNKHNQLAWTSQLNAYTWLVQDSLIQTGVNTGADAIVVTSARANINTLIGSAGTWTCSGSTLHQARAFYWGEVSTPDYMGEGLNYLIWSDAFETNPANLTTFASADQFVSLNGDIAGAASVGPNLLIWTEQGYWYVLQGRGDPALATLTQISNGHIPSTAPHVQPAVMDDQLYFMPPGRDRLVVVDASGVQNDIDLRHLAFSSNEAGLDVFQLKKPVSSSIHNRMIVPAGDRTFHHYANGVWTLQEFYHTSNSTDSRTAYCFDNFTGREIAVATDVDVSADGLMIFERPMNPNRPNEQAGISGNDDDYDQSQGYGVVGLPRISEPLNQVRVRRVVVDGIMYGDATYDPVLKGKVETAESDTELDGIGPATYDTEVTALGTSGEAPFRAVLTPTDAMPYTSFVDVQLYDLVMIGIKSVTVEYEIAAGRIF